MLQRLVARRGWQRWRSAPTVQPGMQRRPAQPAWLPWWPEQVWQELYLLPLQAVLLLVVAATLLARLLEPAMVCLQALVCLPLINKQ